MRLSEVVARIEDAYFQYETAVSTFAHTVKRVNFYKAMLRNDHGYDIVRIASTLKHQQTLAKARAEKVINASRAFTK